MEFAFARKFQIKSIQMTSIWPNVHRLLIGPCHVNSATREMLVHLKIFKIKKLILHRETLKNVLNHEWARTGIL